MWHRSRVGRPSNRGSTPDRNNETLRRIRKTAKSYYYLGRLRPTKRKTSAPTKRLFVTFNISGFFFSKMSRKLYFRYILTRITGILHEDLYTFMIKHRSILLRMRNVSDKSCRENLNTRFMLRHFSSNYRVIYEIMWTFMVKPDRPHIQHNTAHAHFMTDY